MRESVFSRRALRLFGLVGIGIAAAVLIARRDGDVDTLSTTFANIEWLWLALAVGLNLVLGRSGSIAWWTVINQAIPPPRPAYRDVFSAFSVGLLANAVLPGRTGRLARVAILTRRAREQRRGLGQLSQGRSLPTDSSTSSRRSHSRDSCWSPCRYRAGRSRASVSSPRSVALFSSSVLPSPVGTSERRSMGSVVCASWSKGSAGTGHPARTVARFNGGAHQCLAWSAQLLAVWATMRAFHIVLPLSAAALVLVLVNLAVLFPLWPGNIGLLQAAIALPLGWYGIGFANGLEFENRPAGDGDSGRRDAWSRLPRT